MPQAISTEPLVQMLKSISLQKRTGVLKVESLGEKRMEHGEIYFDSGHPTLIRTDKKTGKEAFKLISSWKHMTCSFQGMSKSYSGNVPMLAQPQEREKNKETQPHSLQAGKNNRHTGDLTRTPQQLSEHETGKTSSPSLTAISGTQSQITPLNRPDPSTQARMPMTTAQSTRLDSVTQARMPMILAQPKRPDPSAHTRTSIPAGQINQPGSSASLRTPLPLIPLPPTSGNTPALSGQPDTTQQRNARWTTPLTPEAGQQAFLRKPPVTPRLPLNNTAEENFLPGRQGIFRARSMATTMQSIQQLERRERIIYVLLDGYRTIQDIARLTHRSESEVEQTLMQLTHRGYTEYAGTQQIIPTAREKMANLFRDE